ncbi:MAG: hypothetical protein RR843_11910, partial [Clostridia bacterium]
GGAPTLYLHDAAVSAPDAADAEFASVPGIDGRLDLGAVLALLWCVPVRLLPARWSDFSFYGEQVAALRARPFRAPDVRDELIKWDMLRAGGWCAAACMALWMERMWLRCEKSHGSCC